MWSQGPPVKMYKNYDFNREHFSTLDLAPWYSGPGTMGWRETRQRMNAEPKLEIGVDAIVDRVRVRGIRTLEPLTEVALRATPRPKHQHHKHGVPSFVVGG